MIEIPVFYLKCCKRRALINFTDLFKHFLEQTKPGINLTLGLVEYVRILPPPLQHGPSVEMMIFG